MRWCDRMRAGVEGEPLLLKPDNLTPVAAAADPDPPVEIGGQPPI